jgi:hypothetical protein
MSPHRRTIPDLAPVREEPHSEVRPLVVLYAVPSLAVTMDDLRFLPLDAREAYLLSLVDGQCTIDVILDICEAELGRDEALGLFARLIQLGVIDLEEP